MQTGTQAHRHIGTQAHRHTSTQAHRHTGTQAHRHTGTQTYRQMGTQAVSSPASAPEILASTIRGGDHGETCSHLILRSFYSVVVSPVAAIQNV